MAVHLAFIIDSMIDSSLPSPIVAGMASSSRILAGPVLQQIASASLVLTVDHPHYPDETRSPTVHQRPFLDASTPAKWVCAFCMPFQEDLDKKEKEKGRQEARLLQKCC